MRGMYGLMHDADVPTIDGDWQEVEKLCTKPLVKNHRSFLYSIYKQQYLEYIERREIQKVKAMGWMNDNVSYFFCIGIYISQQAIKAFGASSDETQ